MSLSEQDISLIVQKVRQEVAVKANGHTAGVVVLVPGFVPAPDRALAAIVEHYGEAFELLFLSAVVFPAGGVKSSAMDWQTQTNELVELLVNAPTIVLLAPGTGLLRRIGSGQDEEGVGELLLRRILWGKSLDVLLDFSPPKFKRGTYHAQIAEAVDALSSMGVRFQTYHPADTADQGACSLLTEQAVIDAKRNGLKTVTCARDAIITPLAADTAKELHINIEYV